VKEEKKTGAARTQPATRNEEWSDERIRLFLEVQPPAGIPADYAVLLKAYRGMTADLFARFVPFFVEAGRDINARLEDGSTILDHIAEHRRSGEYMAVLEKAGARKGGVSSA